MHAVLINPNLLVSRDDRFTTGVVYMPVGLASVAASIRKAGFLVTVIDAFGASPKQARWEGSFMALGLDSHQVAERIPGEARVAFVYANQLINHLSMVQIVQRIKVLRPDLPVIILENTQAVTAYALRPIAEQLFQIGADYVLCGEGERTAVKILEATKAGAFPEVLRTIAGVGSPGFFNPPEQIADLDALPFPAWDLFPVENYWDLRFAHGPQSSARYLPLLTSRGCPYPCRFCVVPATNSQKWRGRSAANVVDEMEYMVRAFQVREFHIEDLDPTVNDARIREICRLIVERRLKVTWKIVAGTKVETMRDEATIDAMAQAGCRYISISPESGSARVLKLMHKPFKIDHANRLIRRMRRVGIRSQACFVLGFPGETAEDRQLTRQLLRKLTLQGVDEVALFIVSPVPGSAIYEEFHGYQSLSDLNFTPTWREDYAELSRFRLQLYREFLTWKLIRYPHKIAWQAFNFLRRHFDTKMEMVPYRAMVYRRLTPRPSAAPLEEGVRATCSQTARKQRQAA